MRSTKQILKENIPANELTLSELRQLIDKADQAYYRPGCDPIMTDERYDSLRPALKEIAPDDVRVTRVGCPYDESELRNKVKHPIPMGSLDNTDDSILGYEPWLKSTCEKLRNNGYTVGTDSIRIMASLKVDGGSVRAKYVDGNLVEVATRGNGEVGENITANAANFQYLPTTLPRPVSMDVRGEAIMYVSDYKRVIERDRGVKFDDIPEKERSNPRNIGNGVFGRDDGKDAEKIRFVAFNVEFWNGHEGVEFDTESGKFKTLEDLGFKVVPYKLCESVQEINDFYNNVANGRASLPFEIDGVVVCLDSIEHQNAFVTKDPKTRLRPKYARAIKFGTKIAETVIKDVDITVGHTGAIIPTAILKEVRIGGVNVTHALLNNWDEIKRLDIAIGDKVAVGLMGEIIPKVLAKVPSKPRYKCPKCGFEGTEKEQQAYHTGKFNGDGTTLIRRNTMQIVCGNEVVDLVPVPRQPIAEPKRCPSCGEPTSRYFRGKKGAVTYCSQVQSCPEAMLGKIDHWVGTSKKGAGILDIGDTILQAMWDNKLVEDPADLYKLTVDDLKDVELSGGGRIGKSRATKIVANIAAKKYLPLHVFLGSLGVDLLGRRRVQILAENADGQLDRLEDWLDFKKLQTINIPGFGESMRDAIIGGLSDCVPLIQKLASVGVTIDYPDSKPSDDESAEGKPLDGITCCWTGTRVYINEFQANGGIVKNGVSKGLHLLCQKDPMSSSNKTKKAESYGTKIISIDYLKRLVDGELSPEDLGLSK